METKTENKSKQTTQLQNPPVLSMGDENKVMGDGKH